MPETELHKMRRANNLCLQCGALLDKKGMCCIRCTEQNNENKLQRTFTMHNEGLCTICGKKLDRKGWFCKKCLTKTNAHAVVRSAYRKANHLCVQCGRPTNGRTNCIRCIEMRVQRDIRNKLKDKSK